MAQARPGAPPPLEHPSNRPPTACGSYKRRDQTMIAGETRPAELETPVIVVISFAHSYKCLMALTLYLTAPDRTRPTEWPLFRLLKSWIDTVPRGCVDPE